MSIQYRSIGADAVATAFTSRLEIRAYSNDKRTKRIFGMGFVCPINPDSVKIEYSNVLAGQQGLNSSGPALSMSSNDAERISFKIILTDSSVFHYTGRNVFTLLNNYEVDFFTNLGYSLGLPLSLANDAGQGGSKGKTDFSLTKIKPLNSGVGPTIKYGVPLAERDGHVAIAIERFLNLTTQKPMRDKKTKKFNKAVYLGLVWGRVFTRPGRIKNDKFKAKRQKVYPCYLESVDVNYTQFTRDGRVLRAELDCVFKEDSSGG